MTTSTWLKRTARALPLWLSAVFCCLAPSMAAASQWNVQQIDNAADVGKYASLALDTNRKMHISYFDTTGKLKYATDKSGSWVLTPLSISRPLPAGAGTALAVNASNNPQITYYNYSTSGASTRGIRNRVFNGTTWGSASNVAGANFTPDTGASTAIFHKNGTSYVTYYRSQNLYFSTSNSPNTSWTSTRIDNTISGVGLNNALVVDSTNQVHVIYYDSSANHNLKYLRRSAGATPTWDSPVTVQSTGDVGAYCSIAVGFVNSVETLFVSYLDRTSNTIMVTTHPVTGGPWSTPPVSISAAGSSASYVGGYTSVAVDSTGAAHVSFYYNNAGTGNLRYATNLGGSWHVENVDGSSTAPVVSVGQYSSIAVDASQTVSIAYYDMTNSALKMATKSALLATPNPVPFGTVDRGFQSSPNTTITITNNLAASQTLGTISKGGANASEFIIAGDSCSNHILIPDGFCTLQLYFAPPVSDPPSSLRTASLTIPSTAPYALSNSVTLNGSTSANHLLTASVGNGGTGGTISPEGNVPVPGGGSQIFIMNPFPNFYLTDVLLDGTSQGNPGSNLYSIQNVTSNHTIEAIFGSPIRVVHSPPVYYGALQDALNAAPDGSFIQTQDLSLAVFTGDFALNRPVSAILQGGFNQSYSAQIGMTAITGSLTVNDGTLEIENLEIR